MRFLVDECTGPAVAAWFRRQDHDVFSVYEQARGLSDDGIIQMALDQNRILITNDKDFGAKVFRDGRLHRGVVTSPPPVSGKGRRRIRRCLRTSGQIRQGKISASRMICRSYENGEPSDGAPRCCLAGMTLGRQPRAVRVL